jgi:hypothetical protein
MLGTKGLHGQVPEDRARDNGAGPINGWRPLFALFALWLACSLWFVVEPPVNADGLATPKVGSGGGEPAASNGWSRAKVGAALMEPKATASA